MAALTRRESEERQAAVLRFFMESPTATGEEAQRALINGRLTGKKGPPMGNGMLHRLQRQAHDLAVKGARPPEAPVARGDSAALDADALQALRESAHEVQRLLAESPGSVVEVHITRDGVRVVRLRPTEEAL
jgi:hypothetical protein